MSFEERGIIIISKKDKNGGMIDKDRAELIAIEAGAEEVVDESETQEAQTEDQEQSPAGGDVTGMEDTWTIYTSARDFNVARGAIDKMEEVEILEADCRFIPVTLLPLSEEDMTAATSLLETLRAMDEVNAIYDNIKYE